MNNLLSYCGLVDVRTSASEKDLPVHIIFPGFFLMKNNLCVQTAMCVTAGSIMQGLLLAQRSVDNKINAIRLHIAYI